MRASAGMSLTETGRNQEPTQGHAMPDTNRTAMIAVAALSTWAGAISAQVPEGKRELVGFVRDPQGMAIEGAIIQIPGADTRTDKAGTFRLFTADVDTLTIAIRRPGFSPIEALLTATNRQWDTVAVELEEMTTRLSAVRVEEERYRRAGLRGFEERSKNSVGQFVTREEIVKRNTLRLSDVLRTHRGIAVVRIGNNRYGARFAMYSGSRGRCAPDLWVDGQLARGMEIDDLPANTIEGIELYESFATVPFDFGHTGNAVPCGTIVVWTRPPDAKRP